MAVYTHVSAEAAQAFLSKYDCGELISFKGIAEGVENSNYMLETTNGRFFLTLYEQRVDKSHLPFFYKLLAALKDAGLPVPAFISDSNGQWLQELCGRPACLIEFLEGVSVSHPTAEQAKAVGKALAQLHTASRDFSAHRDNSMGQQSWHGLADDCDKNGLEGIQTGLSDRIATELDYLDQNWPSQLPQGIIHADLFPDNVLMRRNSLSGLIDFYFACNDIWLLDVAITHAAWSFSADGEQYLPQIGTAFLNGYCEERSLSQAEVDSFSTVFRGACLRFLLTRCYDWINISADALVTRKDPLAFLNRLDFYSDPVNIAEISKKI